MAPVSYPRALAMAALQAALSGTWIAAGELSPARRRLARLGSVALVTGIGYVLSPSSASRDADTPLSLRLVAPGSANALGSAAPDLAGSSPAPDPAPDADSDAGPSATASPGAGSSGNGSSGSGSSEGGSSHGLLDASELLGIGDKLEIPFDKRKAVFGGAVVALSVGAVIGRRQLEKRWLARLTSNGHPHPTRGLAVRMAAVEFAGQFALQLAERRRPRP